MQVVLLVPGWLARVFDPAGRDLAQVELDLLRGLGVERLGHGAGEQVGQLDEFAVAFHLWRRFARVARDQRHAAGRHDDARAGAGLAQARPADQLRGKINGKVILGRPGDAFGEQRQHHFVVALERPDDAAEDGQGGGAVVEVEGFGEARRVEAGRLGVGNHTFVEAVARQVAKVQPDPFAGDFGFRVAGVVAQVDKVDAAVVAAAGLGERVAGLRPARLFDQQRAVELKTVMGGVGAALVVIDAKAAALAGRNVKRPQSELPAGRQLRVSA